MVMSGSMLSVITCYRLKCQINMRLFLLLLLEMHIIYGDRYTQYWDSRYSQPYFDNSSRREVTSIVGQVALLQCRVRNLGDRAVSWIRKRDLHILTVGILTYTNDQRFQSLHTDGSDEWTLRITSPQPRDAGTYECQVSTEPKISQGFRLNVVVSRAKILGNSELFIKNGSDINLTCLAMQSLLPPSFIYWYKGKRLMNYSQRGGINVITERTTRSSKLLISKATAADSGNYTCSPSSSDSASVVVHVINGEQPAAMQHGNNSASSSRIRSISKSFQQFNLNAVLFCFSNIYPLYHFFHTLFLTLFNTASSSALFTILKHPNISPNIPSRKLRLIEIVNR